MNQKYLIIDDRTPYSMYLQLKDCVDVIEKETESLSQHWDLLNKYLYELESDFGLKEEDLDIPLGDLSNNEGSKRLLELIRKTLNIKEVK